MTTTEPQRIQMRRTRGWRKPEGAIYVGRPSMWGNPYRVASGPGADGHLEWTVTGPGCDGTETYGHRREDAVDQALELHRALAHTLDSDTLAPLRGNDLACWCPAGQPCHADILLELANQHAGTL